MSNEEIVENIQKGIDVAANQARLWEKNRKFVQWQVRKLCGISERDSDFADYEQEGFIGLLAAAAKYDKKRGAGFLTYAGWHVRAAVIRYSENCSASVRVPAYMKERIRKYESFRQRCYKEKGRFPIREEILEGLHISGKSLDHLEKTLYNMKIVSIDQGASDDGSEGALLELMQNGEDIEELITYSIYSRDLKRALDSALSILDMGARTAIRSVYYQGNSMRQTARLLGCSAQAVCKKIQGGFWKILHSGHRKELEGFMPEGYRYNEYAYSEFAETNGEGSEFLI